MPFTRLLALLAVLAFCGASAFAQKQNDSSDLVVFSGAASMNSSEIVASEPSVPASGTEVGSNPQNVHDDDPLARIDHGQYHSRDRRSFDLMSAADSEKTCLYIRDYRVVRDSPRSDSTHRDGYTTCVPAVRFRVYVTTERER
jgi:hypothetical protein